MEICGKEHNKKAWITVSLRRSLINWPNSTLYHRINKRDRKFKHDCKFLVIDCKCDPNEERKGNFYTHEWIDVPSPLEKEYQLNVALLHFLAITIKQKPGKLFGQYLTLLHFIIFVECSQNHAVM